MVHIGKRIEQIVTDRGMTKVTFADRIGIHRNTVKALYEQQSCDTQLLLKISKVLDFDFFQILSEEFITKGGKKPSMAAEPAAAYKRQPSAPMRVVIELDSEDAGQKAFALELMERVHDSKPKKKG